MDSKLEKLLDEAINLELNVSNLYLLFFELFPKDSNFWWKLVIEEKNHASLIASIKTMSTLMDAFPKGLVPENIEQLRDSNKKVKAITEDFRKIPSRKGAFLIAMEVEQLAGEIHCQEFIKEDDAPEAFKVIQEINKFDIDHAERIKKYMIENNIEDL